jgi:hypothetical protein
MNRPCDRDTSSVAEYEDLFPTIFSELKGIKGDLGEMKIELNPDSKPGQTQAIPLNPRVKEKVKRRLIEC